MKRIIAFSVAAILLVSSFIVVNAEPEDTNQLLAEKLTEVFSELESESDEETTTEPETTKEAETTTKEPETTTKTPETTTKAPETTTKQPETTTVPEPSTVKKNPAKLPDGYYKGDVNKDGYLTAADARNVLKFSAKQITFTEQQCVLADINSNKTVNAQDARLTLRMSAKLDKIIAYPEAKNASTTTIYSKYGNSATYKPYLSGFSTNITDEDVFPLIKELENLCSNYRNVVTFYYTDVHEEYYIQFNSNKVYRTQCTVKAPFVKSMLVYMEENNIPLDTVIYLQNSQRNRWMGHYLSSYSAGTPFTIRDVIYYCIRNSDNVAYQMLFDYFGTDIFNENAKRVGADLRLDSYIFGETSAREMTKLFLDIYNYNGKYKKEFFTHLSNSNTSPLIRNGIPSNVNVMRKSGSGGSATVGYHDCAIIETKVPYVLVIYTSVNTSRYYDKTPFTNIASLTYKINTALYG